MLNEALELLPSLNDLFLRIYVLAYLANIYRDTERFTRAEVIYNEGLELARSQNVRKMELFLLDDWATCAILQQKEEEAFNYIQTSLELADQYELPERKAFSYRNKAWLE